MNAPGTARVAAPAVAAAVDAHPVAPALPPRAHASLAQVPAWVAGSAGSADGEPLAVAERAEFEPRLGASLDHVRLHSDAAAQESAEALQARAFTSGADIYLGPADRDPSTARGRQALAHELAHVVQQGTAAGPLLPHADAEHRAHRTADALLSGGPVPHPGRARRGAVQRLGKGGGGPAPSPLAGAPVLRVMVVGNTQATISISGIAIMTVEGSNLDGMQVVDRYDVNTHAYQLMINLPAGSTFAWNDVALPLLPGVVPGVSGVIGTVVQSLGEQPIVIPQFRRFGPAPSAAPPPAAPPVSPPPTQQQPVPPAPKPAPPQPKITPTPVLTLPTIDPDPVAGMSVIERLKVVIAAAASYLPGELAEQIKQLLSPEALAVMAAFIAAQAVGVGEVADVIGAAILAYKIGFDAIDVADDLYEFVVLTANPSSSKDLDDAGKHLAHAVTLIGVDTLLALLATKGGEGEGEGESGLKDEGKGKGGVKDEGKGGTTDEGKGGTTEEGKGGTDEVDESSVQDEEEQSSRMEEPIDEVTDGVATDEDVHPEDQLEPQVSEPDLDPGVCFPAGTLVATPTGRRRIDSLRPGDRVWSFDHERRRVVASVVEAVTRGRTSRWIDVDCGATPIRTTAAHRFWVESKDDWCRAEDLLPGMSVRTRTGALLEVRGVSGVDVAPATTFNLSVCGTQNYFVGLPGVLVHNITKTRLMWLSRPGFRNYELVNARGKVYYSGMFGPKLSVEQVRARHAANHDRFDPAKGDRLRLRPGQREYGEARLLEQKLAVDGKTIDTSGPKTYRCNRQNPLAAEKVAEYEEYLEVKVGCG